MRSILNLLLGLSLLLLTSCTESPPRVLDSEPVNHPATSNSTDAGDANAVVSNEPETKSGHADAANHQHPAHQPKPDDHSKNSAVATAADPGHADHKPAPSETGGHAKQQPRHGHAVGHGAAAKTKVKIAVGEKVPDFEMTLNGKVVKLSDLQKDAEVTPDGTLVLTFWCSFCHSCRHIEADLDKLAKQNQGKAGVIALDASFGETADGVAAFAKKKGLTMPIALSTNSSAADVLGVNSTTTTLVIDSKGTLRYFGQFGGSGKAYAADALMAVLAGEEVSVKTTLPKG